MISICIPIYNRDITLLLTKLREQCIAFDSTYEIILIDDASEQEYKIGNRTTISNFDDTNIIYEELTKNIGRSAIRNRLAQKASYPYILFIDNDAKIQSQDFVSRYLRVRSAGIICYGGSVFEKEKPDDDFLLRWLYGKSRETIPADVRQKSLKNHFSSFQFFIDKRILLLHPFNENIREYGYEDIIFSIEAMKEGYKITHIDNPLLHDGPISNTDFIERTEVALQNLYNIKHSQDFTSSKLTDHIQILNIVCRIDKLRLTKITAWSYRFLKKIFRKNLLSKKPYLLVFDLYKLGYLCNLKTKEKRC